ncbi:PaREP1 family protein [Vulcanisaeta moutnovskia 768-28]|uniref:PaREP1 family protein n=1 Tax=Vulcanisaeta moutnovskia (strain 768-28) TaxID=985053 RepID=F0QVU9_VULM7|nr:PaREP1 family protein [Vulcanisaeta moutnovskia]ADY02123.1 PaREP1 family protein [Vulcanisaeta moutnovskia 768-28]
MEVGYLDYRKDPRTYVYAKVLDGLVEAKLALEMLIRGLIQNASAKAFMSVKSIVSALIVKNLGKIIEGLDERRRAWYEDVGYSAPTTGLIGISKDLKRVGIDVEAVVRAALSLHRFSYNGFDPNLVDYMDVNEVKDDVIEIVNWVLTIKEFFKEDWNDRLERELSELMNILSKFKAQ